MLGKTFKGLTDVLLEWQTERLLALAVRREPGLVVVRPELVVEVAFDGGKDLLALPGWGRAALRAGPALPRGQAAGAGRHDRGRTPDPCRLSR